MSKLCAIREFGVHKYLTQTLSTIILWFRHLQCYTIFFKLNFSATRLEINLRFRTWSLSIHRANNCRRLQDFGRLRSVVIIIIAGRDFGGDGGGGVRSGGGWVDLWGGGWVDLWGGGRVLRGGQTSGRFELFFPRVERHFY